MVTLSFLNYYKKIGDTTFRHSWNSDPQCNQIFFYKTVIESLLRKLSFKFKLTHTSRRAYCKWTFPCLVLPSMKIKRKKEWRWQKWILHIKGIISILAILFWMSNLPWCQIVISNNCSSWTLFNCVKSCFSIENKQI